MGYIPIVPASNLVSGATADDIAQMNRTIFHECLEVLLQPLNSNNNDSATGIWLSFWNLLTLPSR